MKITVRCFASVRDLLGAGVLEVDVPAGTTLGGLKEVLARRAPDLARLPFAFAVNRDYAPPDRVLAERDEVALIPPISGGSPTGERFGFELTAGPLDPRALEQQVRTDRDGAVVTFAGVTRDHHEGQAVAGLRYEAYDEMARSLMQRLFAECAGRFPITRARVQHRLGAVAIGEASILVVVSAVHRAEAFDACRWLMDRIKEQLPVFKQERLAGGGERWVGDPPRSG